MGKKCGIAVIAALAAVIAGICICIVSVEIDPRPNDAYKDMEEYIRSQYPSIGLVGYSEYLMFSFPGLEDYAEVIAVIRSEDDLTKGRTYGIGEGSGVTVQGHKDIYYSIHSTRNVSKIRSIKDSVGLSDTFDIVQECGINDRDRLIMQEYSYPFTKGAVYLVFMGSSGYDGKLLTLSADNGTFDLTHLKLNRMMNVMMAALQEYDLLDDRSVRKYSEDISLFSQTKPRLFEDSRVGLGDKSTKIVISTPYTESGMELVLYRWDTREGTWYTMPSNTEYGFFLERDFSDLLVTE